MMASYNGQLEIVRTLLEYKADVNAKDNVRNQMMMMTLIIVLTMMMMMMRIEMIVDNDDGYNGHLDDDYDDFHHM